MILGGEIGGDRLARPTSAFKNPAKPVPDRWVLMGEAFPLLIAEDATAQILELRNLTIGDVTVEAYRFHRVQLSYPRWLDPSCHQ